MADRDWEQLRDKLLDTVPNMLREAGWGPPEGETALPIEIVVVIGWLEASGADAITYFRTGSTWSSKGLMRDAYRLMAESDSERDSDPENG